MRLAAGPLRFEAVEDWAAPPADAAWGDVAHVCVLPGDEVLLLNRAPRKLQRFDAAGRYLGALPDAPFGQPHGCCLDGDGRLLVTDDARHTVVRLDAGHRVDLELGTPGVPADTGHVRHPDIHDQVRSTVRAAGPFNRPTGVAVAASGEIYVADGYGNARVHRFAPDGRLLGGWGRPGGGEGEFRLPHGIAIDPRGRIWIADWGNGRLQAFDPEGGFLFAVAGFEGPADLVFDPDGVAFVAEEEWRVSVLDPDAKVMARWDSRTEPEGRRTFVAPHSIDRDSRGHLYVGEVALAYRGIDRGARAVRKLVRTA